MKEAMYYEISGGVVHCTLCPHNCKLREGMTGRCSVRKVIDGKLYSLNYGEVSSIYVDPIEKKPIAEWNPGSKVLSFGTFGCNLHCEYCQNYSISLEKPHTISLTPREIVDKAIELKVPSIAYTYNEPTVFYEMMWDTAKLAKENGICNVLVTNGFVQGEPLAAILEYIDAVNIDLKTYDDDIYRRLGGMTVDVVMNAIREATRSCHVEITMLIVPGLSDDVERLDWLLKELNKVDDSLVLHITRYFPMYKCCQEPTDIDLMFRIKERALKYFDKVYLGNVR